MPSGENVVTRDRMGIQMLDMLVRAKLPQSCPTLCAPVDCSRRAPLSMGFSRQEHWSGLPFPSPGNLPNQGIDLKSPVLQADSLPFEPRGKPE